MKIKNENRYFSIFLRLLAFSRRYKFWIIISVLSALGCAACDLYSVNMIKRLIDKFSTGEGDSFTEIAANMSAIIAVGAAAKYFIKYSTGKFSSGIVYDIRKVSINKIGAIKISEIDKKHSGNLTSELSNNLSAIENFLSNNFTDYIYIPITAGAALIFLSLLNWKLLLISFTCTPIALYIANVLSRPLGRFSEQYYEYIGKSNCIAVDSIKGISVIKLFNLAGVMSGKFKNSLEQAYSQGIKVEMRNEAILPLFIVTYELPYILCAIFGGYLTVMGEIQAGSLIAFIQLLRLLIGPSTQLPNMINNYRNTMGAAKGVFSILDTQVEQLKDSSSCIKKNEPIIEFENVSFSYDGTKDILHNVSFKLYKGEKLAITGESGCGKSTIINLICGFYAPSSGCIKFYGRDIKDLNIKLVREQLSLVSQDSFLFPGTIEDNIKYGNLTAGKEKIIWAAKLANIHDSILQKEKGYGTSVMEAGNSLSGGEKQRISIARAILKDAPVLLLDEPTAALDYECEALIYSGLQEAAKDKAMLMITHRLSSIRNIDKIIVLKDGQLKEQEMGCV